MSSTNCKSCNLRNKKIKAYIQAWSIIFSYVSINLLQINFKFCESIFFFIIERVISKLCSHDISFWSLSKEEEEEEEEEEEVVF
jgi:hypothetical protein